MNVKKITDNIFALHADITTSPLFEGIWNIPEGVTLNSYIVKGNKIALIDLFEHSNSAPKQMEEQLKELNIKLEQVDYLILNHMEPDHTGFLQNFAKCNNHAQIIGSEKAIALVKNFTKIEDDNTSGGSRFRAVKTGDTLDLGGITLSFTEIPNVHWPETMVTYEPESKTLFSCDAFGSYGITKDRIFDDEFTQEEHKAFECSSRRYYANIVASFSTFVNQAIAKLANVEIKTIAPSHGIIWRKNPSEIINRYLKYAGYNTNGNLENEVCVIYGSMYGNTKKGVDAVIKGIEEESVPFTLLDVAKDCDSEILGEAYKAKCLVIAMPTYEYKMFPLMAHILDLFQRKHFTGKTVLRIGSWGWSGGAQREYEPIAESLKWTQLEKYEWQGIPSKDDLELLHKKGNEIAKAAK